MRNRVHRTPRSRYSRLECRLFALGALAVAALAFLLIAATAELMATVWAHSGARDVLVTAAGFLVFATVAYLIDRRQRRQRAQQG